MIQDVPRWRRFGVPAIVFVAVMGMHFVWLSLLPEQDRAHSQWETVTADGASWLGIYIARGSYWQGYAYGISTAFVCVALRRFRERRLFGAGKAALGGATLSGILAVAGCFLAGCCGSPMLTVYWSLFGATFLPWAKPLVAGLTTAMILASYWWMLRKERACCGSARACRGAGIDCGGNGVEEIDVSP